MSELPVNNVINVSITNTPSGLTEKNVNSLALFTNEPSNTFDPFNVYISAAQVAADFGTNSVTAAMANAIFAQTPNLRTGNGRLVIVKLLSSVSATSGTFTTTDITANLAAIIAINNGQLKITINGVANNLLNMNFNNCVTFADIAAVIQANVVDCTVTATGTGLLFRSKKVGTTSTMALAAATGGSGTDINGVGYLNASAGTAVAGVNSTGETLSAAITRTSSLVGYVGVISTLNLEDAAITANANFIQARDNMYLQHVASTQDVAGIGTSIKAAGNTKTRILLLTTGMAEANLMKAAYAGRAFSVNFRGSFTASTMNLKQLATITPDGGISQTLYLAADVAGVDLYVSYDGVPSVFSTYGNDFFDNPYADLALKFALETAGFNFLRQTNTKVPQTESGMNGLKSAYAQVCERFIRNGEIAPGAWTSSETFGDPGIFKNNVLTRGYYIYSLPIVSQDAAERELRKAPLVQIAIKRAGAIQTSDVIVLVND